MMYATRAAHRIGTGCQPQARPPVLCPSCAYLSVLDYLALIAGYTSDLS